MTARNSCGLVRDNPSGGYPTDYLVARVQGRQASLIDDWNSIARARTASGLPDEQAWGTFQTELAWLHRQMNPATLGAVAPLFGLFAVKTLVLALRNVAILRHEQVRTLLDRSLLDRQVQEVLRRAPDVRSALGRLAGLDTPAAPLFAGLTQAYEEGKLRGLEDGLMKRFLELTTATALHPVLRDFFAFFIDLRNIMLVYKHIRWNSNAESLAIAGGNIEPVVLRRIATRRDTAALAALARRVAGRRPPPAATEAALETLLLTAITERLARVRRDAQQINVLVSYMWRLYVQARNLAVLAHVRDADPDLLERELIA